MAQPRPGTLEALAAAAPDQVVLVEHGTGRRHTRATWDERAGRLALALAAEHEIGFGTRVALETPGPTLELFEALLALAKLAAVPVHVHPEHRYEGDAEVRLRCTPGDAIDELIAAAPDGEAPHSGVRVAPLTISTTASGRFVERLDDRGDRSGLAVVLGDLITRTRHRQGRSHLIAAPVWHPSTLLHANVALLAGGRTVLLPAFSPVTWLDAVGEHEISTAVLTAGQLTEILAADTDLLDECDTTSLDAVIVVGGAVAADAREQALDLFGEQELALVYATAETGPIAVLAPADIAEDPGTDGTPLQGVTVTIRTPEGTPVARGETGIIHVASPLGTEPEVATGDHGRRDDDGRLVVEPR